VIEAQLTWHGRIILFFREVSPSLNKLTEPSKRLIEKR
jgi:hypothetical protein